MSLEDRKVKDEEVLHDLGLLPSNISCRPLEGARRLTHGLRSRFLIYLGFCLGHLLGHLFQFLFPLLLILRLPLLSDLALKSDVPFHPIPSFTI